jgi:hypothetical protein
MSPIAMICFFEDMRDNATKNYWKEMRSVKRKEEGILWRVIPA